MLFFASALVPSVVTDSDSEGTIYHAESGFQVRAFLVVLGSDALVPVRGIRRIGRDFVGFVAGPLSMRWAILGPCVVYPDLQVFVEPLLAHGIRRCGERNSYARLFPWSMSKPDQALASSYTNELRQTSRSGERVRPTR